MTDISDQQIIDEFRANRGQVGGQFAGLRLLLLTTTGARSGDPHTVPLGYLPDGERILIIASPSRGPEDPEWLQHLQANPRVGIDLGIFRYDATATVLDGEERDRLFARAVEADPGWGDFQAGSERPLPVIALTQIPGPPDFGTVSFGTRLKLVHDAFRRELALIRKEIAGLIDDLQRVISTEDADAPRVLAEVERLIEELERHLSYEEEQLIPLLDRA